MKNIIVTLILFASAARAQFHQPNAADLQIAVNTLPVLGSVLYVAAHPDDENTAFLSYCTKEKYYRTAYLSITRGEGGQNAIGMELGPDLGIIRTQELLAARRIDGAEQYFTRAIDFGYSKSPDETLRLWNKDSVLKDVVFVIRTFRPDVIITRFSPVQGGHGHHLASAILAQEAFKISGDPNVYPEQLRFVKPWKAKRILFNHFRFGNVASNTQNIPAIKIDVGTYNPLLGRSYTELAGISRTMHKSQAMGSSLNRGSSVNEFVVTDGAAAARDIMEGIDVTWNRIPNGKKIARLVNDIRQKFNPQHPDKSIPALVQLYATIQPINNDPLIERKMKDVESLIIACAGFSIEARSRTPEVTPGDSVQITMMMVNRSSVPVTVRSFYSSQLKINTATQRQLNNNEPFRMQLNSMIAHDEPFTQPYWLEHETAGYRYAVGNDALIGLAEDPPPFTIPVTVSIAHRMMMLHVPVRYTWVDDINGEQFRDLVVVPPVSVSIPEKTIIGNTAAPSQLNVRIKALRENVTGTLKITAPKEWQVGEEKKFSIPEKNREQHYTFSLRPDSAADNGQFLVSAVTSTGTHSQTVTAISYPHIPPQTELKPASGMLLNIDIKKHGRTVGYIMGAGDEVPKALRQMGYSVTMVNDDELRGGDLSKYDAIVAGIRSYNTREQLRLSHARLMEYVSNGGTYLVQYQVMERGITDNIAPYSMEITRDRVTDETAPVTFVDASHPVLQSPNVITANDFDGWVQERGLYFARTTDEHFQKIIACSDPAENPLTGGLLIAPYGKGHYIFTGLSFFRQLPAGVPGAYRIFSNLISIGK
jgi:LmbE family N-acetylglucosaminyl deacetylase